MPGYFNIDKAVKHIKIIADNNRCKTCDKLLGLCWRYACGHITCEECIETSDECLICFNFSQNSAALIDRVQTQHVQNVFNLLTVFQETFNIDVNKRHRLSEKFKEEQQIFPECIQATIKYYNKRRSSQISTKKNKENLSPLVIAGEQISYLQPIKMNTRINLVQKWLESNENIQSPVRKPFADINVNSSFISSKENNGLSKSKQLYDKKYSIKKRKKSTNKNIVSVKQKKSLNNLSVPSLRQFDEENTVKDQNAETELKSNKIFNGKELVQFDNCQRDQKSPNENLDTIVIEDTPIQEFDKDKAAWLAVLETEKNNLIDGKQTNSTDNYDIPMIKTHKPFPANVFKERKNVSYYKKALLYQSCQFCIYNGKNDSTEYQRLHSKDVFITVNTCSTLASIKITNNDHNTNLKNSISTQTVEVNEETNKNIHITSIPIDDKQIDITSQDLFVNDTNLLEKDSNILQNENTKNNDLNKSCELPCQVINDSDSDSDIHCSGTFEVIAEVHTPSKRDYGVLSEMKNDHQRVRHSSRRRTVDSNNSSEKENVEPNRPKKPRMGKKQNMKK